MRSPLLWLLILVLAIGVITALGPAEKALGSYVRIVYLHGAWVWTALACFAAAALLGAIGLLIRRQSLHSWSCALGRAGLIYWITYLPLSLWAMQTNWNGLFLAEPRWRLAMVFAAGGLFLQIGIYLLENPAWASAMNLIYAILLFTSLQNTREIMHPSSPIFGSGAWRIQIYFLLLLACTMLAAWQLTRWLHGIDFATQLQDKGR